jgi:predicted ATP-grasp superfamily ATP-dependent carboligase
MRILVLDGNQNQAVAAVRYLARAGHTVLAGDSTSWSKAGWSRYCRQHFEYPAPKMDAEAFVRRIAEMTRAQTGTLVLPMTEATTLPISTYRDAIFQSGGRLVLPSHQELLRAFDKDQTTRLATSLGIAVPKTILVSNRTDAKDAANSIGYPVVLKPRASEEFSLQGSLQTTGRPQYASNLDELASAYDNISPTSSAILIQQFVKGEGTGYFALMRHGEVLAEFAHRRIRDVYPTGSGSAVRVSVKPEPAIRQAALAMLRGLNWHGVAMVEFRSLPDASPIFLEVNGRFWHSLSLACYAGVDFPALLAKMAETSDGAPAALPEYRLGVRCRWLLGDFRHLIGVWRGPPAGFPEPYPGRLKTLASFLTPVPGTRHDLFTWDDPLPELGDWLYSAQRFATSKPKRKGLHAKGGYSHP